MTKNNNNKTNKTTTTTKTKNKTGRNKVICTSQTDVQMILLVPCLSSLCFWCLSMMPLCPGSNEERKGRCLQVMHVVSEGQLLPSRSPDSPEDEKSGVVANGATDESSQ